jgi:metabolite-proton symporter
MNQLTRVHALRNPDTAHEDLAGAAQSPRRVLFASLVGTSIEFFDFYAYATAAVLVFPKLFFPAGDPASATLQSLATFALAFFARPLGAALFGHFGDRTGRKATLVAALLTMGTSTLLIGLLPTFSSVGVLAPVLLAVCRFGQGLGLGGEWGGAVLLATENAPPGKRTWYGMFPQLGAPIGFLSSTGVFLLLSGELDDAQFLEWGWRVPFLASTLLVVIGLYVRQRLGETREFARVIENGKRVRVPMLAVCADHLCTLVLATFAAAAAFVIFYLMTVFCLSWGTTHLGYTRPQVLTVQMVGMLSLALMIPVSAVLSDKWSARATLTVAMVGLIAFGLSAGPLLGSKTSAGVLLFTLGGFGLAGLVYGPLGTALAKLFPTAVRYTGISLAFNLAGILGASLTPYIATWLATNHGLASTGYFLSAITLLSLIALRLA